MKHNTLFIFLLLAMSVIVAACGSNPVSTPEPMVNTKVYTCTLSTLPSNFPTDGSFRPITEIKPWGYMEPEWGWVDTVVSVAEELTLGHAFILLRNGQEKVFYQVEGSSLGIIIIPTPNALPVWFIVDYSVYGGGDCTGFNN